MTADVAGYEQWQLVVVWDSEFAARKHKVDCGLVGLAMRSHERGENGPKGHRGPRGHRGEEGAVCVDPARVYSVVLAGDSGLRGVPVVAMGLIIPGMRCRGGSHTGSASAPLACADAGCRSSDTQGGVPRAARPADSGSVKKTLPVAERHPRGSSQSYNKDFVTQNPPSLERRALCSSGMVKMHLRQLACFERMRACYSMCVTWSNGDSSTLEPFVMYT